MVAAPLRGPAPISSLIRVALVAVALEAAEEAE